MFKQNSYKKILLSIIVGLIVIFVYTRFNPVEIDNLADSDNSEIVQLEYWSPSITDSFQWQLADYPVDTSVDADIYDVDLFETSKETINFLHDKDKKVICYINVGSVEEYRDDYDEFPSEVIGNDYDGWEGENWLDISNYKMFSKVLETRFDLAKQKGCDGIEPDNIEGYQEDTGFNLTYEDQLEFNKWIANQAHSRGMSIGLKNDPEQVVDLVDYYDWALLEDCHIWGFCDDFVPFTDASKAVFQVEYTDNDIQLSGFCTQARDNQFIGILKNRDLDAWVELCE